mmetsp:Transcript_144451/g.448482  ORF Transcript_144451/g.448482 Transcript_144451/m.448482 type:complete len:200 (+) Transcript_144451:852-1451(+)
MSLRLLDLCIARLSRPASRLDAASSETARTSLRATNCPRDSAAASAAASFCRASMVCSSCFRSSSLGSPNQALVLATTYAYTKAMANKTEARKKSMTGKAHANRTMETAEKSASLRNVLLGMANTPPAVTNGQAPVMTRTLKMAEPTIVPMPTLECVRNIAHVFVRSSGPLHAKAISVAPATSSGMAHRSHMMSTVGTR